MLEIAAALKLAAAGGCLAWVVAILAMKPRRNLHIAWGVFCAAMAAYMIRDVFGDAVGAAEPVLLIAGCGTCSVFWLVARALFRTNAPVGPAQVLIIAGIFAPTLIDQTLLAVSAENWMGTRLFGSLTDGLDGFQTLLSSTVLVLAFWEGVRGWSPRLTPNERRLRVMFLATFGLCVSACVMLLDHGRADFPAGAMAMIQAACAVAILAAISVAVRYRTLNPLVEPEPVAARAAPMPATPDEKALGHRIRTLMDTEKPYLDPDFKVAALARRLREPDYKVSRAITAGLGQANFNRFINAYRIAHARAMLREAALVREPVLNIALDSGFASLGPFNRAFKEQTGLTPRAYRTAHATDGAARQLAAE